MSRHTPNTLSRGDREYVENFTKAQRGRATTKELPRNPKSQTRKSQTPINNIGMPRYTGQNVQRSTNPKLQILNSAAGRGFILRPWSLRTLTARKAEAYENCRLKFSLKSTLLPHSTAKILRRKGRRIEHEEPRGRVTELYR